MRDVVEGIVEAVRESAAGHRLHTMRMDMSYGESNGFGDGVVLQVKIGHPEREDEWLQIEVDFRFGVLIVFTRLEDRGTWEQKRDRVASLLGTDADLGRIIRGLELFVAEWLGGAWRLYQQQSLFGGFRLRVLRGASRWAEWRGLDEERPVRRRATWVQYGWQDASSELRGREFLADWEARSAAEDGWDREGVETATPLTRVQPLGIKEEMELGERERLAYLALLERVVHGELGNAAWGIEIELDPAGRSECLGYYPMAPVLALAPLNQQTVHYAGQEPEEQASTLEGARERAEKICAWWREKLAAAKTEGAAR